MTKLNGRVHSLFHFLLTYRWVPAGTLWSWQDVSFPFGTPVCFTPNAIRLFVCSFHISVIALSIVSASSNFVGEFTCLAGLWMAQKTRRTAHKPSGPVVQITAWVESCRLSAIDVV